MKRLTALTFGIFLAFLAGAQVTTSPLVTGVGVDLSTSTVTGTLPVSKGGTGATTMTGIPVGSGTAAFAAYAGTSCTNQFPRSLNASGAATCASVANADLAGSIAASKLVGTDIATVGTITSGAWTGTDIAFANIAQAATNTVLGNSTAGTADLAALAVGSCSTAGSALIWTTNTGFGCNTSIAANTATTATNATNQSGGTVNATTGAFSGNVTITNTGDDANFVATSQVNSGAGLFIGNGKPLAAGNAVMVMRAQDQGTMTGSISFVRDAGGANSSYLVIGTKASAGAVTDAVTVSVAQAVRFNAYGAGTATFDGSGNITSVSDEREKIDDGTPKNPTSMLMAIRPRYFYWRNKHRFNDQRQLGFFAQNVNAAIGEEAAPTPMPRKEIRRGEQGKPDEEYTFTPPWGYYDRSVLATAVLVIQEQQSRIEALEKKLAGVK